MYKQAMDFCVGCFTKTGSSRNLPLLSSFPQIGMIFKGKPSARPGSSTAGPIIINKARKLFLSSLAGQFEPEKPPDSYTHVGYQEKTQNCQTYSAQHAHMCVHEAWLSLTRAAHNSYSRMMQITVTRTLAWWFLCTVIRFQMPMVLYTVYRK